MKLEKKVCKYCNSSIQMTSTYVTSDFKEIVAEKGFCCPVCSSREKIPPLDNKGIAVLLDEFLIGKNISTTSLKPERIIETLRFFKSQIKE